MLEPTPKRLARPPVEEASDGRWRTPSKCAGALRAWIGECNLIFLRLTRERLRLFAAELRGEFGGGGGVIGGGGAIGGAFAERVEGGIRGTHALLRDGGLVGGREAWAGEQRLNCGEQERAVLSAL